MASDPSAAQAADLACWAEEGHAFASLLRYLSTVERRSSAECHRIIALWPGLYDSSRPENDDEAGAAVWAADNVGGAERGMAGDDFISTAGGAGGTSSTDEPSCVKRLALLDSSSAPPSRFISTAGGAGGTSSTDEPSCVKRLALLDSSSAPPSRFISTAGGAGGTSSTDEPSCVKRLAPLDSSASPSRKVAKHETVASLVQTKAPLAKCEETRTSNDCLAMRHGHPNDKRITFDEPSHTYYLDLIKLPISVTALCSAQFDSFVSADIVRQYWDKWSQDRCHKLYVLITYLTARGLQSAQAQQAVIQMWTTHGTSQSELGTAMHLRIEQSLDAEPPDGRAMTEDGDTSVASDVKEMRQYEQWRRDVHDNFGWRPYRVEWCIYSPRYLVGGSVDALFIDPVGSYHLIDWKRCREPLSEKTPHYGRFGRAGGPVAHVKQTKYHKYCLQLNVYRLILEAGVSYHSSNKEGVRRGRKLERMMKTDTGIVLLAALCWF